ncbi:MAG: hypothetical protein MO846_07010 [Candidatus Devosia symbiotica]|nr:hypothetical protein [Candidatus Devosia symbiotica]
MLQSCILYYHAIDEQGGALESPGGNAAMQKLTSCLVLLLAAHDDLALFAMTLKLMGPKTGDGDGNNELLSVLGTDSAFDIIERIAVGGFGQPIDALLETLEAEEK